MIVEIDIDKLKHAIREGIVASTLISETDPDLPALAAFVTGWVFQALRADRVDKRPAGDPA